MCAAPENESSQAAPRHGHILLTGSTGYVGRCLLPRLEAGSLQVRCLARSPEKLQGDVAASTEVVWGDLFVRDSLAEAMQDITAAYYLVHSMGSETDFQTRDRLAAENFGRAAREAGVGRIIYLGGLGHDGDNLSPHLKSRHEVGRILRESGVPTIEFRASIILGQGSLSFELVRSLTERLPVMICPRWLTTPTQPIAIDDVVAYLLAALELPGDESRIIEIGGDDQVTYGDLIRIYARQRGLRRTLISVPLLSPYLSSLWLGLVTPTSASVGKHLIEGLRNPTVVRDRASAENLFDIRPIGVEEAIRRALERESNHSAPPGG